VRRALVLSLLLTTATAFADDAPRALVRAHLDPAGPVVAGQTVRLVVDVLVTTWLTRQPELPPLEIPGVVATPSGEQALNLTQQIEGTSWFGVSLAYLVTPTQGGELAVPPIELALSVGQAAEPVRVRTSPLTISVRAVPRPPGAERAVGATRLELTQRLDRSLDGLRVGDSLTRTVEISADGVRAMFLPPAEFAAVPGLAVYPAAPQVDDVMQERVGFTGGRRVDAASYVVQEPGTYELPALSVTWWDTKAGTLRTASVPAVRFRAAPNPDAAPEIALPAEALRAKRAAAVMRIGLDVAALAVVLLTAWLLAPRMRRAWHAAAERRADRRRRYEASEEWAFARLREAAHGGDAGRTYGALTCWVARVRPDGEAMTIGSLCASAGDPVLTNQIDALEQRLYADEAGAGSWSAGELTRRLTAARARLQPHAHDTAGARDLGPLNPA
jgi:hypothetical protein